jgi:hypothetical protein
MTETYFTPDIEDIRIGLECEYTTDSLAFRVHAVECISKQKLGFWDIEEMVGLGINEDLKNHIRIPYLNKEQIEAEGWKSIGKGAGPYWFEKTGNFKGGFWRVVISYDYTAHHLLVVFDDMGEPHHVFEGECKDINTLRYISKLLGI